MRDTLKSALSVQDMGIADAEIPARRVTSPPRSRTSTVVHYVLIAAAILIFVVARNFSNPYVSTVPNSGMSVYVGLSLSLTHAAASISFGGDTNLTIPVNFKAGDINYRATIDHLSTSDARHVRPPYSGYLVPCPSIYCPNELARQWSRSIRKKVGLPATTDVGRLAQPLRPLIAELDAMITTKGFAWNRDALLVTPALQALYDEDIRDVVEYLGLRQIDAPRLHGHPHGPGDMGCQGPYEAQAAFLAAGLGMCRQWWDPSACKAEVDGWSLEYVLTLEYTRAGIVISRAGMRIAEIPIGYPYNAEMYSWAGFGLFGSDSQSRNENEDGYWRNISAAVTSRLHGAGSWYNISNVFIFGESAASEDGRKLESIVRAVLGQVQDLEPLFHRTDAMYAVAKGAAEMAKRGGPQWANVTAPATAGNVVRHERLRSTAPDPLACPWYGGRYD
jgi:hypothetical protein